MIAGAFSSTSGKADSVLTTKGDLATYSTTRIREAVGTNNFTLMADSAQATGIKWAASPTSVLTTQSDILYASSANTLARLAKGDASQVLAMNSGTTAPEWVTPSSGLWTQVGNFRATGDGGLASFTSLGIDLDNDYSKVVLIMTGKSASAANAGFYLNNISSGGNYDYTNILNDSTTVTGVLNAGQNVINILPSGIIDAIDNYFSIFLEITFSGDDDEFLYQFSGGTAHEGNIVGVGKGSIGGGDELGQINVSFGGSGWQTGTQINVYKVAI